MKCTECQHPDIRVIESREADDGCAIRRRRQCASCSFRFTTYERVERPPLVVIKNDGARQLFSRSKLLAGLYKACDKTPVNSWQLERMVSEIEQKLHELGEPEVKSVYIGELVMKGLANLNEVAYVRFASVYRRFSDIEGFEKELAEIRRTRETTEIVTK